MLILKNCRFFCVPKTGSTFCTHAISENCEVGVHPEHYHAGVEAKSGSHLPAFGIIRHPVTWYESYWRYRMSTGWQPETHNIDQACHADDFESFIVNVLDQYPGWLSSYFERWMGPNLDYLDLVGSYESLLDDLCAALSHFGEVFDEEKLRCTPKHNVGDRVKFPCDPISDELRERIMNSEHRIIDKYYSEESEGVELERDFRTYL